MFDLFPSLFFSIAPGSHLRSHSHRSHIHLITIDNNNSVDFELSKTSSVFHERNNNNSNNKKKTKYEENVEEETDCCAAFARFIAVSLAFSIILLNCVQ